MIACQNKAEKKEVKVINSFYKKAYKYRDLKITDSAFKYYNIAKDVFLLEKDSLNAGKCLVNMGIIASYNGDFFGSQEIALSAINYFDVNNEDHYYYIHSNFNNLGIICYELRDFTSSLKFYDSALKFVRDSASKLLYLNNKAKSYEEIGRYTEAIEIYTYVLNGANLKPTDYARALANIAFAKWLKDPNYNPVPELKQSLLIREREDDSWGLNYTYARLADYYAKINPRLAEFYAEKMYIVASLLKSPDDRLEAYEKLVRFSSLDRSRTYFEHFTQLNDSLQKVRVKAKNQFAIIRYETERLQKENSEKQYQIAKRELLLGGAVLLLITGAIIASLWYKKRKQKIEAKAQSDIRESQLKTSKKVHDRVANKVYNVMMEVENTDNLNKTNLADKLELIYKISRDISYENNDINYKIDFDQQLIQMLNDYSSDSIEIIVNGNCNELWNDVNENTKSEIMIILQELMTNMVKHSQATEVQLLFKRIENQIQISYVDNGMGIAGKLLYKNGLTNTGNRITEIGGTINFDTTVQRGLEIKISFPVI